MLRIIGKYHDILQRHNFMLHRNASYAIPNQALPSADGILLCCFISLPWSTTSGHRIHLIFLIDASHAFHAPRTSMRLVPSAERCRRVPEARMPKQLGTREPLPSEDAGERAPRRPPSRPSATSGRPAVARASPRTQQHGQLFPDHGSGGLGVLSQANRKSPGTDGKSNQ